MKIIYQEPEDRPIKAIKTESAATVAVTVEPIGCNIYFFFDHDTNKGEHLRIAKSEITPEFCDALLKLAQQ